MSKLDWGKSKLKKLDEIYKENEKLKELLLEIINIHTNDINFEYVKRARELLN